MRTRVRMCVYVLCKYVCRCQRSSEAPIQLESQIFVSCLIRMLRTKVRSSAGATPGLSHGAVLIAFHSAFCSQANRKPYWNYSLMLHLAWTTQLWWLSVLLVSGSMHSAMSHKTSKIPPEKETWGFCFLLSLLIFTRCNLWITNYSVNWTRIWLLQAKSS